MTSLLVATESTVLVVDANRSVAIDPGRPDVVIVSASSSPRSAYVAGVSDGRLYRREEAGRWERVRRMARSTEHDRAAAHGRRIAGRVVGSRRTRRASVE